MLDKKPKKVTLYFFEPQCSCATREVVVAQNQIVCASCYTYFLSKEAEIKSVKHA